MKTKSFIIIISAGILLASCSHKQADNQNTDGGDSLITITQEQFIAGNLTIGEPVKMSFEDIVRCNGRIVAEPSGNARISTPVQGFVRNIKCSAGQKVYQGQELFELTGNEFIEIQRDLAETVSQLKRLKSEYERIKSLYEEKVGTEKDLILAESEFSASNAKYSALKIKIRSLGLDESRIEAGEFYESFSLRSPISGFISSIDVSIGQYTELQTIFAEIFDPAKLRLKLAVFEKDLSSLKENQKVRFNLIGDTDRILSARLRSVGKNVDEATKTIICYAGFDESDGSYFINNAYVEATIVTRIDSAFAVPEESILRSEGNSYILELVKNEDNIYFFKRTRAETGRLFKGFVEIINVPDNLNLITKGAYNIKID